VLTQPLSMDCPRRVRKVMDRPPPSPGWVHPVSHPCSKLGNADNVIQKRFYTLQTQTQTYHLPFLIWNMGGTRGAPARERGVPCPQSSGLHTDSMRTVHTWAILQKQLCKYTEPTRPCPWIVRGESTKSWTSRPPPLAGGSRCPTGVPN
jgi:hypothetical protein